MAEEEVSWWEGEQQRKDGQPQALPLIEASIASSPESGQSGSTFGPGERAGVTPRKWVERSECQSTGLASVERRGCDGLAPRVESSAVQRKGEKHLRSLYP